MKYTDYDTKFEAMEEKARREREALGDIVYNLSPVKTPLMGKSGHAWIVDELAKPALKRGTADVTKEEMLVNKVQELEQKLKRKNELKRNVDRRLREATKKLKQIEEAVQKARTAVHNPVLVAPQREVSV